LGGSRLRDPLP
jgi:hypothetical protein